MSSKVYEIAMQLKGKLEGSFIKSASNAIKHVDKLNHSFNSIASHKLALDKILAQAQATKKAYYAYDEAKAKVKALEKQLQSAKSGHKELRAELLNAVNAMNRAEKAYTDGKNKLSQLKAEANATGKSLKDLEAKSDALNKRLQAKANIEAQTQKAQALAEKAESMQAKGLGNIAKATAMTAAAFGMPIKAAMDIEDQTAELRKYTDISDEVMKKNKEMATKMAVSTEEMVALQANAMQSNILDANDAKQIETYTQTAAKAMIALTMTGDQVGSSFAAIKNQIAGNMEDTIKAFDLVNAIANNTTAGGKETLEVLERSGGMVAASTKLTTSQIVALSGAFLSASGSAEVAATAQSSFINALMAGSNATNTQLKGFEKLGLSPQKMAKALTTGGAEAQYAIEEVFKRINKLSADEKNSVVGQIFGNEAGLKKAVMTMAEQGHILSKPFELAANELNYLGSMQKEYEARAATTSNQLGILNNLVTIISATIGSVFLPAINELLGAAIEMSQPYIAWIENNKELVKTIGTGVAIFLALIAAIGAAQLAFGLMLKPIISLINIFVMLKKAMLLVNMAMLANPIGLVITAITALIGVGYLLYKHWDTIQAKAVELWATFEQKFPAMASVVKTVATAIGQYINYVKTVLSNMLGFIVNVFTGKWGEAWANVKNIFKAMFDALKGIAEGPINYVTDKVEQVKGAFGNAVNSVKSFFGFGDDANVNVNATASQPSVTSATSIPALANGGIVSKPTLAMIGEGAESEAVMPLSKLGSMLGTSSTTTNTTNNAPITVTFAPTINIQGDQNVKGQVNEALNVGSINLKKELEKLMRGSGQIAY
ncbi:Phage-related minor tail protein [Anaerobiospirillum thomasii]|uniref:phage tail tape measure protein n=1 Tax=Anaerobiospirillum thomasii TaxID=179995 RepID=UPI000D8624D4|nr:phage tail tape measure protein [Anaerobiospirillum thomasii]SPT67650.1 Phage-related minor tail protein [Anaerobiospirillum thomasii]SPT68714.1 Phage-related minor tail protein [Anaerobiospirillum thomasii]SPT72416.1 Phage-related minor tail protein [Anaerobiospirillum thomasii]